MYIPINYASDSWELQADIIKRYPLATVITNGPDGLFANHLPFLLVVDEVTGKKFLHAHIAKKNPQISALSKSDEVLIVFQSQDSYISPSYYPGKAETHKYVPTWDFAAVHIKGRSQIIDDPDWVRMQLEGFTNQSESKREDPWKVNQAPESYLTIMQKAITGLKIEIVSIESKFKFEQKMKLADVKGVIDGLAKDGVTDVSKFVEEWNKDKFS